MGMRTVMLCSIAVAWALTLVAIAHRPDLIDEPRANNDLKGPLLITAFALCGNNPAMLEPLRRTWGIRNVMMQPRSLLRSRRFAESSKSRFSAPSPHIISKSPLTQYKRPPESSPPKFFRYLSRRQFTPYCASSDLTSGRFRMC
jgi:hypothetical protein